MGSWESRGSPPPPSLLAAWRRLGGEGGPCAARGGGGALMSTGQSQAELCPTSNQKQRLGVQRSRVRPGRVLRAWIGC